MRAASPDADVDILAERVPAAFFTRAVVRAEAIDDAYVDRLVDVLVPLVDVLVPPIPRSHGHATGSSCGLDGTCVSSRRTGSVDLR